VEIVGKFPFPDGKVDIIKMMEEAADPIANDPRVCPICGKRAKWSARCPALDSGCEDGHEWHTCVEHKVKVIGPSGPNKGGRGWCTCGGNTGAINSIYRNNPRCIECGSINFRPGFMDHPAKCYNCMDEEDLLDSNLEEVDEPRCAYCEEPMELVRKDPELYICRKKSCIERKRRNGKREDIYPEEEKVSEESS